MLTIERAKEEVTIVEVLAWFGGRSTMTTRGGDWKPVVCPFCADSGGSASLNIVQGRFLCHQCGAPRDGRSGDVVDVVMYAENFRDTRDALAWIEKTFL